MTSMHRSLWVFAAILLLAAPALGQEYRGRVQGSLTDEAQLALPGAQVTLRNDATGVAVTRREGPQARYLFDYVDPGTYTVTAEFDGFTTVVQRNVFVQARGDVTVDVTMNVAGLTETVTVEASPVAIQFNTADSCSTPCAWSSNVRNKPQFGVPVGSMTDSISAGSSPVEASGGSSSVYESASRPELS